MKKKHERDESIKFGPIEVSRSGNVVSIKNEKNNEYYSSFIEIMAKEYESTQLKIDVLINEIRDLISLCNPLEILKYGYDRFVESIAGIPSEVQQSAEDVMKGREIEYIQSVLVSSNNKYNLTDIAINNDHLFEGISAKINELYSLTQSILMYRTANLQKNSKSDIDLEMEEFLIEAQISMFVRGDRYQVYEIPHLKSLIAPHNDELIKLYGISANDFIDGMTKIQKALTSVKNTFFNILGENGGQIIKLVQLFESYEEFEKKELNDDNSLFNKDTMKAFLKSLDMNSEMISSNNVYDNFNLEIITKLPRNLLEDLSYKLGENQYFYNNEFSGYPTVELPVFERPFINIENKFYCFSYFNLFDNIYRVMQKTIRSKDLSYKDKWVSIQMETTENIVVELFKKILPNCIVYTSNYYPKNKSLKQCNENDILVLYDDNLIVVEVKAGSYSYRAPILDIESHIKSLQTLVEKADGQAERMLQYLKSNKPAKLYDSNKIEKCEINIEDFNEVTLMCVTLDNFNEFCAKIEKVNFLNINKNSIAISIDDLRVYSDYFESPLEFLHFLKKRKIATQNKNLYLNDELDHLGMYIENIWYSKVFEDEESKHVNAYGFREELDTYFGSLVNKGFEIDKPRQNIPYEIKRILDFLENSDIKGRVRLSGILLDFSNESKDSLSNMITEALIRQKEISGMLQINLTGDAPLCIFCHQYGVKDMALKDCRDYTLANMLQMNEDLRLELHVFYNKDEEIYDVKFNFCTIEDISEDRREALNKIGEDLVRTRIKKYILEKEIKKVGRNEICPCGSGKKYKRCHGK